MKRSTRKSAVGAVEVRDSIGNFSTRFSLPSFIRRVEKLTDCQRIAIENLGFGNLLLMPNHTLSKNLLVELMEKWSTEKHVFVLPHGEIAFTLLDVALILGLRVIGKPVLLEEDEPFMDLEKEYGAAPGKRKITVASLESRLDSLGEVADDNFIRTFLLFTFGTFLFPNTNGKVDTRYLSFLSNMNDVRQYAWGAAVLEELLAWLNKRKETNIQYVGGCLILLQIWSYEHIDIARPSLLGNTLTFPRACRWDNSKPHPRQWFTTKFKELRDDQIVWELQPTSTELVVDVIRELLAAKIDGNQDASLQSRPRDSLANFPMHSVVESGSGSDLETFNGTHVSEMIHAMKPWPPKGKVKSPNHFECPSQQEASDVPTELPSRTCDFPRRLSADTEDDLILKNQTLEGRIVQLETEISELKKENILLKQQLFSGTPLEKENVDLKKEVADLRRDNRLLSLSSDRLVTSIEKLLLDEDVNGIAET